MEIPPPPLQYTQTHIYHTNTFRLYCISYLFQHPPPQAHHSLAGIGGGGGGCYMYVPSHYPRHPDKLLLLPAFPERFCVIQEADSTSNRFRRSSIRGSLTCLHAREPKPRVGERHERRSSTLKNPQLFGCFCCCLFSVILRIS